ncbi:RNA polymerase sigma-70 factor (ECF subfamily) [Kineococcus radiotolerans]|uniref:RNA polymerase, sigma-24 subunit, ECF subfamily n=2 Tax=Kineococcus radiotolerans TaxID=131568 RepID=A6W8Z7_KINRD|nr:sigma-70 family RNA polymerase sigma factor [Kineococcus radiotolerans]ABS03286.1 RNA polymerase, sigma-24 subunit, ECF subfamily [Kineococcus radiotolerans SRS30216 = ATCC BAA-149]MBB2899596.1 RNA polymerase sigma-70 factor (ECF subfamily) [Kineococcus radiotolerans]
MTEADEELVRALHDEHAGALWSYVVSLTGDRASAHDVVQETLLRAWRHPESLDPARGSTRGWLFTVARRLVIDDWRSARNRRESVHADVPDRVVVDESEQVLQQWVVTQALTRLSPEHRAVLGECYFRGRSVAEAARTLAIPEGTVKSRTHYALMNLRLALQEMGVSR